jgi:hypothetical protein
VLEKVFGAFEDFAAQTYRLNESFEAGPTVGIIINDKDNRLP